MHTDSLHIIQDKSGKSPRPEDLAERDWLTGLYNRRAVERIFHEFSSDETHGLVFLVAVTNLSQLNNRYGHLIGDHILKETAKILGFLFSRKELIGRLDGNEFLIFSPGSDSTERMESIIQQLSVSGHGSGCICRKRKYDRAEDPGCFSAGYGNAGTSLSASCRISDGRNPLTQTGKSKGVSWRIYYAAGIHPCFFRIVPSVTVFRRSPSVHKPGSGFRFPDTLLL